MPWRAGGQLRGTSNVLDSGRGEVMPRSQAATVAGGHGRRIGRSIGRLSWSCRAGDRGERGGCYRQCICGEQVNDNAEVVATSGSSAIVSQAAVTG